MRANTYGQPVGAAVPEWTERARAARVTLVGQYCRIEPVDVERHAKSLYAAYAESPDDRDWTYLFTTRPHDLAACLAHVERLAASVDPLHYVIVDLESGDAGGTAALMRMDPVHGGIEVGGITYAPRLQRTRAGTEAMYLLMRYAFDDLGYRRYEWKCDSLNAPSLAAARRYGFVYEGTFRQVVVYKGRNRDTSWFSITNGEWPRVRGAFEAWLSPDNFDAAGVQVRSLSNLR